jgi:hypothetical protein
MTSYIELLRRTRPFVVTALPLVVLCACTPQDTERVVAFATGSTPPTEQYALTVPVEGNAVPSVEPSSEEHVSVAHEICEDPWEWRGTLQPGACHFEYW